jgi:hypothetical protein
MREVTGQPGSRIQLPFFSFGPLDWQFSSEYLPSLTVDGSTITQSKKLPDRSFHQGQLNPKPVISCIFDRGKRFALAHSLDVNYTERSWQKPNKPVLCAQSNKILLLLTVDGSEHKVHDLRSYILLDDPQVATNGKGTLLYLLPLVEVDCSTISR